MKLIVGLAVCIAGIGWLKFGAYLPEGGWVIVMIGAYIALKDKTTLKSKRNGDVE